MGFGNAQRVPPRRSGEEWVAKGNWAVAKAAATQVKAAPTDVNDCLYLEWVLFSTDTAGWIQVVRDTGGGANEVLPKTYLAANGSGQPQFFARPIKITKGQNLGIIDNIAGNHSVTFGGFTAR